MICPKCGETISLFVKKCPKCGLDMVSSEAFQLTEEKSEATGLEGIKGWLILLAIGVGITPLMLSLSFIMDVKTFADPPAEIIYLKNNFPTYYSSCTPLSLLNLQKFSLPSTLPFSSLPKKPRWSNGGSDFAFFTWHLHSYSRFSASHTVCITSEQTRDF